MSLQCRDPGSLPARCAPPLAPQLIRSSVAYKGISAPSKRVLNIQVARSPQLRQPNPTVRNTVKMTA